MSLLVCSQTGPKRSGPKFLRPERFSVTPIPAPTLPAPVKKMQPYRSQSNEIRKIREIRTPCYRNMSLA